MIVKSLSLTSIEGDIIGSYLTNDALQRFKQIASNHFDPKLLDEALFDFNLVYTANPQKALDSFMLLVLDPEVFKCRLAFLMAIDKKIKSDSKLKELVDKYKPTTDQIQRLDKVSQIIIQEGIYQAMDQGLITAEEVSWITWNSELLEKVRRGLSDIKDSEV